jgi:hypothetical protein
MMTFFLGFEIYLFILVGVDIGLSLGMIFVGFDFESLGFFIVHIRRSCIICFFDRHCIIIPKIDDPIQVIFSDKFIFDEVFKFSNVACHKISFFCYKIFFFFLHSYNKK